MAKAIPVTTDNSHTMEVTKRKGLFVVTIDGKESNSFKPSTASNFFGMHEDFPIMMDDKEYILAVRGAKFRLALSGRYVDNGEKFKVSKNLPVWFWILGVIDLMLIFLGGAIGGALGFLAAGLSAVISRNSLPAVVRILFCLLLTIAAYAIWFALASGIYSLTS